MNWYKLIMGKDNRVPNPYFANEYDLRGTDWDDLITGTVVSNWNPNAKYWSDKPEYDGEPDDILRECLHVPAFSQRFRNALIAADVAINDIQYLPIDVFRSTGEEISGFAIANVTTRLPAFDRERSFLLSVDESQIDPLTGLPHVEGIGKPALKESVVQGHDMIRLLEFFPAVLVSQRFVDVFNDNHFTGATFTPLKVVK